LIKAFLQLKINLESLKTSKAKFLEFACSILLAVEGFWYLYNASPMHHAKKTT